MERDEQVAHIDARWATGDPYALAQYAEFYADNNLQLIDPSARIKSYAYIYAYYEAAVESAKYNSDVQRFAELQWALNRVRQNHEAILSGFELEEAYELARTKIESNGNCCFRLSPVGE
jgi:hypothetical protein